VDGYGLPLGSKKRVLSGDRYMLVGDAASLIDPFTGEGIGNAFILVKMLLLMQPMLSKQIIFLKQPLRSMM